PPSRLAKRAPPLLEAFDSNTELPIVASTRDRYAAPPLSASLSRRTDSSSCRCTAAPLLGEGVSTQIAPPFAALLPRSRLCSMRRLPCSCVPRLLQYTAPPSCAWLSVKTLRSSAAVQAQPVHAVGTSESAPPLSPATLPIQLLFSLADSVSVPSPNTARPPPCRSAVLPCMVTPMSSRVVSPSSSSAIAPPRAA